MAGLLGILGGFSHQRGGSFHKRPKGFGFISDATKVDCVARDDAHRRCEQQRTGSVEQRRTGSVERDGSLAQCSCVGHCPPGWSHAMPPSLVDLPVR